MINAASFLVLEASEKATYDSVVAIGPDQVIGLPAFLEGKHWLMGKTEIKDLDRKLKVATLGIVTLRRGNKCYSTLEKYYLKNAPSLKKVLFLTLGFIAPEG